MSDALASASASFEVLQRQLNDCTNNVEQLQRVAMPSRTNDGAAVSASVTALMVRNIEMLYLVNFFFVFFSSSIWPHSTSTSCIYNFMKKFQHDFNVVESTMHILSIILLIFQFSFRTNKSALFFFSSIN